MSNDASLIAQHVVGLTTLSPAAVEAGKVSGLADLSSFDAGLIAQWIVCINNPINQSGTWKFNPTHVDHGTGVIGQNLTEDYTATLMGDVSGDWNPALPARPLAEDPNGVRASVPDSSAQAGSIVTVPLSIDNLVGKGVTSYQFDIEYDASVLQPVENAADIASTKADGMTVFSNAPEPGLLKVVVFGALPVSGDGLYANLKFAVVGRAGSASDLNIRRFSVDDGTAATTTTAGRLIVTASDQLGSLTGRLLSADGTPLRGIYVTIINPGGETSRAVTSSFGYFRFEGLPLGETYQLSVESKRYRFSPTSVSLTASMGEVDLTAINDQ
jgi:hypothetical protein